jgi:hypothetical protein
MPLDPLIHRAKARKLRKPKRWQVCRALPYGTWTEDNGAVVFFDLDYAPLCRRHPDGRVELVGPDVWIRWHRQEWLYEGKTNPDWCKATRKKLDKLVAELGIADVVLTRAVAMANRR